MVTYSQIMTGRRLLKRLLPAAMQAVQDGEFRARMETDVAKNLSTVLRLENLDAVVISEGARGGWHTDVAFRNIPPGFPTAIGSPVQTPYVSYQAALEDAPLMLIYVLHVIEQGKTQAQAAPVFEFHDFVITLHPPMLQALIDKGIREGLSVGAAMGKLRDLDPLVANLGSAGTFELLPDETRRLIITRCHMAAALGIFRYPPIEPKAP